MMKRVLKFENSLAYEAGVHQFCGANDDTNLERLRFTFTPNGKREFVPRDQVFPLFFVDCLLLLHKISEFMLVLSTRIVLDCFYLLIFYAEKFSTDVCRLSYAVNVNLNLCSPAILHVEME